MAPTWAAGGTMAVDPLAWQPSTASRADMSASRLFDRISRLPRMSDAVRPSKPATGHSGQLKAHQSNLNCC